MTNRPATPIEHADEIVRQFRETDISIRALARANNSTYMRLRRLIKRVVPSEEYAALIKRRPICNMWKKGRIPWNKGKVGLVQMQTPHGIAAQLLLEIGETTIHKVHNRHTRKHKSAPKQYRMIKVSDSGPRSKRLIPYARYVWEQAHNRTVPAGACVYHKDGDTLNDSIENLMLVKGPREMMRLLQTNPEAMARRVKNSTAALIQRNRARKFVTKAMRREQKRTYYRMNKWRQTMSEKSRIILECQECGADLDAGTEQCPKCGSFNIEQLTITPIPDSEAEGVYVKQAESA